MVITNSTSGVRLIKKVKRNTSEGVVTVNCLFVRVYGVISEDPECCRARNQAIRHRYQYSVAEATLAWPMIYTY